MNVGKKEYEKVFWTIFVIIFLVAAVVVGKVIFDSAYSGGYKRMSMLPKLSSEPIQISNTERYGYVASNEIWSGTIHVTGDIIVTKGTTLTIKRGTTVTIAANKDKENLMTLPFWQKTGVYEGEGRNQYIHQGEPYRDEKNHITIWVEGTLNATGTENEKIIIKSDSPNPTRYDWNTFHIEKGALSFAEVKDYRALNLKTGTVLTNSELHNVGECPICIHESDNILIANNHVYDSGHEIVDILKSSPTIVNNYFGPSPRFKNPGGYYSGWGGLIVGSGFPTIKNNTFEGFNDAVSFFNKESYEKLGEVVLKENIFKDNVENVVFNPNPG